MSSLEFSVFGNCHLKWLWVEILSWSQMEISCWLHDDMPYVPVSETHPTHLILSLSAEISGGMPVWLIDYLTFHASSEIWPVCCIWWLSAMNVSESCVSVCKKRSGTTSLFHIAHRAAARLQTWLPCFLVYIRMLICFKNAYIRVKFSYSFRC